MSEFTEALGRLIAIHVQIGSPVPDYLRPGADPAEVRARVLGATGLPATTELVELFNWHDGTDDSAWQGDGAGPGFARLFGDAHLGSLGDSVRAYGEALDIDRRTGSAIWRPSWFPVFALGWDSFGVELDAGGRYGAVYEVGWHPPVADPLPPRFASLRHLVECAIRRFEAGGYRWNRNDRFLDADDRVLDRLYRLEAAEASGPGPPS